MLSFLAATIERQERGRSILKRSSRWSSRSTSKFSSSARAFPQKRRQREWRSSSSSGAKNEAAEGMVERRLARGVLHVSASQDFSLHLHDRGKNGCAIQRPELVHHGARPAME